MGWGPLGDFVEAAGDLVDDAVDLGEDLVDAAGDVVDDIGDFLDDVGDELGDVIDAIGDLAEDAIDALEEQLGDAWDQAERWVEDAGDAIESAWESTAGAVEDAWNEIGELVDDIADAAEGIASSAWDAIEGAAEAAWEAFTDAIDAAWDAAVAATMTVADWAVQAYEESLEVIASTIEWLGELGESAWEYIVKLGGCLGGLVIYRLAKAGNVLANFGRTARLLPSEFVRDMAPIFGGTSFAGVWYIDDASLSSNWYQKGTPVDGMTFAGATIAGVTLNNVVYVRDPWEVVEDIARKLMAHELVHVVQYRRLKTEAAFACAYGIGYAEAGFDYRGNPFEVEAYDFADANEQEIVG
ncbi:hypothetical protein ARHIZOSPH14_06620 [Agromyces rhizosphaerae]|uniref:DUF4157 domain-containing protein n=1 Tax=Agromyces rhizosphaerae TaxID=88374 RepID=A0A9W6CVF7_9MICO|nr:hypothetical protein [Agromyces rhizosphaerae]GLI26420.1 hypothetical protein ARHIZOSPH14_06620 [Agromyces rhizosphaerae]